MLVKLSKKRAHQRYRTKDGRICPGASTVSKIGEDQSNLINWAWKQGTEGIDYKKKTDEAADIGTIAHFLIECFLRGDEADLDEFSADCINVGRQVFDKFLDTWAKAQLRYVASEVSLVSELGFGGTIDIVALDKDDKLVLVDEKSTPRIYGSYYRQIAAYEHLWNENNDTKINSRVIFRHGKTDPNDVETRWLGDMSKHMNVFRKQLDLYYAFKEL